MSSPRDATLTLSDLIAPLPVADFLGGYWQKRHFHAPGPNPLTDKLRAILGGFEVAHLLTLASEITAFGYVGARTDRRDQVTPAQALELYERDYTLYFTLGRSAPLRELAATVAQNAGISTLSACSSVFASKTSGGLRNHFDNNENFTVQLAGSKVWTIWPNTVVDSPIHSYRRGEPLVVPDSGMYIDARASSAPLGEGTDVAMSPGAVLYHPRGSWHATRAASESVSLNVCLEPMTWYDVLFGAAAARLASSSMLRTIVPGLHTTDDLGEIGRRAGGMVNAAHRALADLTPEDAVDACLVPPGLDADVGTLAAQCTARITPTSRLRKSSLAAIDVTRDPNEARMTISLFLGRLTRHVTVRAPAEWAHVFERAAGPEREWVPRKLSGGDVREDDLVAVARALSVAGAVRIVSGKR